jgi:hypothetical protein
MKSHERDAREAALATGKLPPSSEAAPPASAVSKNQVLRPSNALLESLDRGTTPLMIFSPPKSEIDQWCSIFSIRKILFGPFFDTPPVLFLVL